MFTTRWRQPGTEMETRHTNTQAQVWILCQLHIYFCTASHRHTVYFLSGFLYFIRLCSSALQPSCSLQQHAVSCQYSVTLCSNWCSPSLASLKQNKQKISIKNIYLFHNNTHGNFTQTNTHTKQQNARLILRISPLLLFMENNHGRIWYSNGAEEESRGCHAEQLKKSCDSNVRWTLWFISSTSNTLTCIHQ